MSEPLVSILIPCFNCSTWVDKAIQSALRQTWKRKEIIVMDDGSQDDSWRVVNSFGAAVRTERQANQGPTMTRNRLLAISRGDWIQFLDADDELAVDKIARQMEHRHLGDVLYGSMRLVWFDGIRPVKQHEKNAEPQADAWAAWFQWKYPNPDAFLFRRDLMERVGGWDPRYKLLCEDYALLSRLLFAGARLTPTPEAWSLYRQWGPTQSVIRYENQLAEIRFELMLEVAKRLEEQGELTGKRRSAFQDNAFLTVRNLYKTSPETGKLAWSRLRNQAHSYIPSFRCVPSAYRLLYQCLGFVGAEKVAGWRRSLFRALASRS